MLELTSALSGTKRFLILFQSSKLDSFTEWKKNELG